MKPYPDGMLPRLFTHRMLGPDDLKPRHHGMKIIGTFNPGAVGTPDGVVLLVRVCEAPIEHRDGHLPSPRITPEGTLRIDWYPEHVCDTTDPRTFRHCESGANRLRFISYLRVFRSRDGQTLDDLDGGVIYPEGEFESFGIEDPRITRLGDTYYITYVAVSEHGVATSLMSTRDFRTFTRHGVIFAPENKDVVIFPEKIGGYYVAMHRPVPSLRFVPPEMWIAQSPDLVHWGHHAQLVSADRSEHSDRVGGGTPPVRVDGGFLTIYHGSDRKPHEKRVGKYTGSTLLLDAENPARILARSAGPIMEPTFDFEVNGFVDAVVFPTALIERGDEYWVYYGAADTCVGVMGFHRDALLATVG